jgi:hypothetical protein
MAVPALLPVLDFAPWTGWFFLDELDLLLLATSAIGYARIGPDDRPAALPAFFSWSLGFVLASALVAAFIGLMPWSPLDANAFSNYWHVKNFAVNTYFEQGWIGVAAMVLLLLFLGGDLAIRGLHGETMAALGLAALAGFLMVGMFDSLFDVPRLTLAFFLVAFAAVMRPAKRSASGDGAPRRREPEIQSAEAPVRQAEKSSIAP